MKSNTFISLLSLLIIFSACKKSNPTGPKVYVPAYLKAMGPYTNGQSVSFSNGAGQTINATVSITTRWSHTGVCSSCAAYSNLESITYTFNAGPNKFIVLGIGTEPYIFLSIYSPQDNYQLIGGFNFLVDPATSFGSCGAQSQACLASATLNGKTFTNVLEITGGGPSSVVKAYHTLSQGIVGFKHANGSIYALD